MYQVELYIRSCIQSILSQSYKDFEIVIVDDGSSDKSIEIAENELVDSLVSYKILKQENKGLSSARNLGISSSAGNWVVCVDSDDCLDIHFLKILVTNAEKTGADVSICGFRYVESYQTGIIKNNNFRYRFYEGETLQKYFLIRSIVIIIPCLLIKKEVLVSNKLSFNEKIHFSEDQEFIWRLLSFGLHFVVTESKLYDYLVRPNSIMTTLNMDKILSGFIGLKKMLSELDLKYPNLILARWILGTLRTTSKISTYQEFQRVYDNIEMVKYESQLWLFPSFYVKILFLVNRLNKRLLYLILKKI
ncbi:glycosyltransferase [Leptospira levettii]|uniref:Glycosyltransferase n=1 Tax=Leptospira levettii TaxID=2023178 RepID=A0AAW5VEZ1_9LEPT|nr:glycosyltransferase [Leptospira levettii]MCW7512251.1 glycosyltransferase [Leptospira levettii]MCW7516259.1 glycosyltransferase [Leptospira levettii]